MIIENRKGSDTMPPFSTKDKDERFVQLPAETLDLLTQYQQEVPEGVPYILLTKERYGRVVSSSSKMMLGVNNFTGPWSNHNWRQSSHRKTHFFLKHVGVEFSAGVKGRYQVFAPQYPLRLSPL